jgi:hypothetical protein
MIYLFIFLFLFSLSVLFDFKNIAVSPKPFWITAYLIFVSLMAFRYKLGGDTFNYMSDFKNFPYFSQLTLDSFVGLKYAPLWILLFSLIKSVFTHFLYFQLIHAVFVNGVIFWFIDRYSRFRFTSLLLYFLYYYLYFNTEIIRESISICLFLLVVPSFLAGNWKKYYILTLIAFLFHYSAIILLIFPLLKNVKTRWIYYVGAILLLYFVSFLVLSMLPPIFAELYKTYVVFEPNLGGYLYTTCCFIFFPALLLYIQKKYISEEYIFNSFVFVFFLISVYTYLSPSIALRFFNYLVPIASLVFINFIGDLLEKRIAISSVVLFFVPCLLFFKSQEYFQDTSSILPGTRFYFRWHPYTHVFGLENKTQFDVVEQREKWVDYYFNNLVDDVKELTF